MPPSNVCWGVEIGAGAIKALKLVRDGDELTVADFVVVQHPKPLSTPDLDQADALRVAIGTLASQVDFAKAQVAVSVAGHSSFARFAKLPPVEKKKVPDIVKYEAVQQIPFPIEEVEWDYQTFGGDDEDPEVEVGIFAITREKVMERIALCKEVEIDTDMLTISPVSVFNAIAYDEAFTADSPGTVILDIGTTATDLIVAEGGRVWIRTFPLGGHHFTEALVNAFKLPYGKAEKLKREAERSQHKRHIFQAMKPVFADLAQDVQRSLAYYRQGHPNADLKRVIGIGSTFRLMGLRKFLSQQLGMDVVRFDKAKRLKVEGSKEADFQSVTLNMATAYGLALQCVGLGTINANLIPLPVIRESVWKRKTPWFAAAAALALVAGGLSFYRPVVDGRAVEQARQSDATRTIDQTTRVGREQVQAWQDASTSVQIGNTVAELERLMQRRDVHARLVDDVGLMLAAAEPQPALLMGEEESAPPGERRMFELQTLNIQYITPSGGAPKGPETTGAAGGGGRDDSERRRRGGGGGSSSQLGFFGGAQEESAGRGSRGRDREAEDVGGQHGALAIQMTVTSTHAGKQAFVDSTLLQWLRDNAERPDAPYTFRTGSIDEMIVSFQERTIGDGPEGAGAQGRAGDGGAFGGGSRRGQERTTTSAQAGDISGMAPLPIEEESLPPGTTVYEYTIQWVVPLRDPQEVEAARETAANGGEQGGATDSESTRERSAS